jgi:outer membrane protein OmpA-like peptidoglycan-associated protein
MASTVKTAAWGAAVAAVTLAGCAPVQKFRSRAQMERAPACTDFEFPVYFASGSEQMPAAALQVIRAHAAQVKACKVASVTVTGLADAEGSAQANMELSRRRAASVASALAASGYPTPTFAVGAAGAAGAETAAGTAPLRRRTDVSVKFAQSRPGA